MSTTGPTTLSRPREGALACILYDTADPAQLAGHSGLGPRQLPLFVPVLCEAAGSETAQSLRSSRSPLHNVGPCRRRSSASSLPVHTDSVRGLH
jgi:hypothetical protein